MAWSYRKEILVRCLLEGTDPEVRSMDEVMFVVEADWFLRKRLYDGSKWWDMDDVQRAKHVIDVLDEVT